jgi:HKD family nuclease
MEVRFVSQPYDDSQNLMDFISQSSSETKFDSLTICVAWAKRSGIELVRPALENFRERGGILTTILGISEGGATKQGLSLAHELSSKAYVFHDRRSATFHPKIYLFKGPKISKLFVGSNNLTAGGSYYNYEAATITSIENSKVEDSKLLSDVEAYFSKLISDTNLCIPLTSSLIHDLVTEPRYRIADEDNSWRNRIRALTQEDENDEEDVDEIITTPKPLLEIFGKSIHTRTSRPRSSSIKSTMHGTSKNSTKAVPLITLKPSKGSAKKSALIFETWSKKLNASDAQHPPQKDSAVTGNVRLSQAGNPIDHKTYFREIFFGGENWIGVESGENGYEKCLVEIEVIENGNNMGLVPFRIDHKAARIADQNNVPTVLKWGPNMGAYMRQNNHIDEWLTLVSYADGSYQMLITKDDPRNLS